MFMNTFGKMKYDLIQEEQKGCIGNKESFPMLKMSRLTISKIAKSCFLFYLVVLFQFLATFLQDFLQDILR